MNTSYQRHPQRGRALRASVIVFAAAALGWTGAAIASSGDKAETKVVVKVDETPLNREADGGLRVSFSPIVKKVAPAVVQVEVTDEVQKVSAAQLPPFLRDPRMRRYFGLPDGDEFELPRAEPQRGAGSGVIVSEDGYILTNNHVVQNADKIEVTLDNGKTHKATVVGTDPDTDLAVIKIEAENLPALTFADSNAIEVGDTVLAVGNPFGLGQTVTSGMVSALGRATMGLAYEDFIQTDAAINPGNSGGALVDTNGRLVGINTAILSRSGGFQGIGFAIPANLARNVMQQLATDGKVTRGFLGVFLDELTPELAEQFGLEENTKGVLISDVSEDTPAEKAGLEHGDIIVSVNGRSYNSLRELRFAVANLRPGEEAEFKIIRDGDEKTIDVEIGSRDGDVAALNPNVDKADEGSLNGVQVANLDPRLRRQYGVQSRTQGALIVEVDPESASYEAGLRPGMVILEINRQRVTDADEAVQLTEKSSPDGKTLVRVWSARYGFGYVVVDESGDE